MPHAGPTGSEEEDHVRYVYSLTSALLLGGAAVSLATGWPAGAQVAQAGEAGGAKLMEELIGRIRVV